MIIPENERSKEPLDDERVITHPDIVRANEWIINHYEPHRRDFCIFVPCAKAKPYHKSPSHKIYDSIIYSLLPREKVHIVAFGTCGVTPRELDTEYPFMDYNFMIGKCNIPSVKREFIKIESKRIAKYLEKTRNLYKHRIAYCIGDFRKAMLKAIEITDIPVDIVPKNETMMKCIQPDKKFIYGSLCMQEYLQDLSDIITSILGIERKIVDCEEMVNNDNDWYIL